MSWILRYQLISYHGNTRKQATLRAHPALCWQWAECWLLLKISFQLNWFIHYVYYFLFCSTPANLSFIYIPQVFMCCANWYKAFHSKLESCFMLKLSEYYECRVTVAGRPAMLVLAWLETWWFPCQNYGLCLRKQTGDRNFYRARWCCNVDVGESLFLSVTL